MNKEADNNIITALQAQTIRQQARLDQYEQAVSGIASWLSASLTKDSCKEYEDACNAIFELDKKGK